MDDLGSVAQNTAAGAAVNAQTTAGLEWGDLQLPESGVDGDGMWNVAGVWPDSLSRSPSLWQRAGP